MFAVACGSLFVFAATVHGSPMGDLSLFGYKPQVNPAAVAMADATAPYARFTVLTDHVIRMEYASTPGVFEDRATITFVNRYVANPPNFSATVASGWLSIHTSAVSMRYKIGTPFSPLTLFATTAAGASWRYGDVDYQNLFGAVRSLDDVCFVTLNCSENFWLMENGESLHCGWGVVSRGGWTTINDTAAYIMSDKKGGWFDVQDRSADAVDMYFFGHGPHYRQALADYTLLAGKVPMVHRAMLGSWYTRWYDFDNADIKRLVGIHEAQGLPLDLLVLDMNWHRKNSWTGYSWDTDLFPVPADLRTFLKHKGLRTAANLHDAEGVASFEDTYPALCAALGANCTNNATIEFAPLNATYMHALDDIVLPAAGFDFYWIDWQQGGTKGGCPGDAMNPTLITNHVRGTDHARRHEDQRDAVLARWGGMGSHRYPVGFSGDVLLVTWICFAFQPYFSVAAANVGYSWSHDLVGPPLDHELHVRWLQFGAFSSIMRIHDRGLSTGFLYPDVEIVNVWKLPFRYFEPIRAAMLQRVSLLPYMYTAMRSTYDTGVQMVYPMYYDWPDASEAYLMNGNGTFAQYMFGPSILVAPVCTQGNQFQLATKLVWLPPGQWYDDVRGQVLQGGSALLNFTYDIAELPLFYRAGSVVPRIPAPETIGVGSKPFAAIDWWIYPGAANGTYTLYEDDAQTVGYLSGHALWTTVSYVRPAPTTVVFSVSPPTGAGFAGQLLQRTLRVMLPMSMPIASASFTVGSGSGASLHYCRFDVTEPLCFGYDGETATASLSLPALPVASPIVVSIVLQAAQDDKLLAKTKGIASRTRLGKRVLDNYRYTPYSTKPGPGLLKQAAARAEYLTFLAGADAAQFSALIGPSYMELLQGAITETETQVPAELEVGTAVAELLATL
jgi:hypothetical protein